VKQKNLIVYAALHFVFVNF